MPMKTLEQLDLDITETVEQLKKRPLDSIAAALVFTMSELIVAREDKEPTELQELILQAGKEAVMLTDGVYLAQPRGTETIH